MAPSEVKRRKGALRTAFGAAVCALAIAAAWSGLPLYWSAVLLCAGVFIILGRRRILRPGLVRASDEVVVRYLPWLEGNAYLLNVALPLIGLASIVASGAAHNPPWLRFVGVILIALTPLFTWSAVRMWRRSFLHITPSALTSQSSAPKDELIVLSREHVESISPKVVPNGVGGEWLQVEIAYTTADSNATQTLLLGLQLTVEPANLLNALVAWREAADDDPEELLDRVEALLRGRSMAGA